MTETKTADPEDRAANEAASSEADDDYCGMPLDAWRKALRDDIRKRFGETPDDLVSAEKAGW